MFIKARYIKHLARDTRKLVSVLQNIVFSQKQKSYLLYFYRIKTFFLFKLEELIKLILNNFLYEFQQKYLVKFRMFDKKLFKIVLT